MGGGFGGGRDAMGGMGDKLRTIQWDLAALPKFEKNFYIEHPAVTGRDEQSAEEWRKAQGITVIGRGVPKVGQKIFIFFLWHDLSLYFAVCSACIHLRGSFDARVRSQGSIEAGLHQA
jgi:hypothetical protein